jgi:hypothetical protein
VSDRQGHTGPSVGLERGGVEDLGRFALPLAASGFTEMRLGSSPGPRPFTTEPAALPPALAPQ